MKRSEMIEILRDTFRRYDTCESIAERALSAVENAGMLPPYNASLDDEHPEPYEWEPEND